MIVADAGPLIALAKIGGLSMLFDVYPEIVSPEAVYEEAVRQGQAALPLTLDQLLCRFCRFGWHLIWEPA